MMKKTTLSIFGFSALLLLALMSFASAAIGATVNPTSLIFKPYDITKIFTVTNDDTATLTLISPQTIFDNQGNSVPVTFNQTVIPASAINYQITATLGTIPADFTLGTFLVVYDLTPANTTDNSNLTLNFENTPNKDVNKNDDLQIDIDASVESGFGDDNEWYPMDYITVDIEVRNDASDDSINNIEVEWGLYNRDDGEWVIKEKENDFDLDGDEEKTLTIDFQLDKLSRLDGNDYVFYAWARGEHEIDDNFTSTYDFEDIDVPVDSHFVVLDEIEIVGTASCGEQVQVSAKVWNIGDDNEDNVYVLVSNSELGISQKVDVGDIDAFEDQDLLFILDIPEDASEKTYNLLLQVYDEDDELFQNDNDDEAEFTLPLTVESGSCSTEVPVTVSANLETSANVGEEFSVKATITNTASTRKTFTLEVNDFADWSSLVSIDKTSLTLDAGASTDVLIKLNANEGASGSKSFSIVISEGSKVFTQPVSVPVQGTGFSITGWFAGLGLGGNAYLWVIGALNVLLVLVIIIVAARVVRKKQ